MGLEDREYYRLDYQPRRPAVGGWSVSSVTTWIIVINVLVFFADALLFRRGIVYVLDLRSVGVRPVVMPPLEGLGHFSAYTAIDRHQLWRFITFQFLHANLTHLLFNMIALYFFGPLIEAYLGRLRYLAFYLLCGVGGAASYLVLWRLGWLGTGRYQMLVGRFLPLVGASAGIYGTLIASAIVLPNATALVYGIIPVKLKTLAFIMIAIAMYMVWTNGRNAGGEAAHLGGAVVGVFLMRLGWLWRRVTAARHRVPASRF